VPARIRRNDGRRNRIGEGVKEERERERERGRGRERERERT